MKKISLAIIFNLIFIPFFYAQDISEFYNELTYLKNKLKETVNEKTTVEELEEAIEEINGDAENLESDFESFIEENSINEYHNLLLMNEIKDFNYFTSQNKTCDCLNNINKFISELGGYTRLLKEQEDIKIYVAEIGNFNFYYAYSKVQRLCTVTIKTIKKNGNGSFQFGLGGEIEVFSITEKRIPWKITKLNVKIISTNLEFLKTPCRNEFPRK